jgi:homocysteine S-methyltransferase
MQSLEKSDLFGLQRLYRNPAVAASRNSAGSTHPEHTRPTPEDAMTTTRSRTVLPHEGAQLYIGDAGLETAMVFHEGLDLPCFAAFTLLETQAGRAALDRYFRRFFDIARRDGRGLVLDTVTWRANADWGAKLGHDAAALDAINRGSVDHARHLRDRYGAGIPVVINGILGPRGDGYNPEAFMTAEAARAYHAPQIASLAAAGVDMVSAMTMTYVDEAVGIARAAADRGVPLCVSFTVETDGRLISGPSLREAIEATEAATGGSPVFYMVNCAHPDHFRDALDGDAWLGRIGAIRANASRLSHAELDAAEELDAGDPLALGADYRALAAILPNLRVVGGCCGTDHRHVDAISTACHHRHAA